MIVAEPSALGSVTYPEGPKTTEELVRQFPGIVAALDGSMFDYAAGEPHDYGSYRRGVNRFAMFYPPRGIDYGGLTPRDGVTLGVLASGRTYAKRGNTHEPGSMWAAQFFPPLVFDGVVTPTLSDVDNNKRAGVGFLRDGKAFLAVAPSMSMPEFARTLRDMGAVNAGYSDGGGSAALYADVEGDGVPEYTYNLRGRRVISWVTIEKKSMLATGVQRVSAVVSGMSNLKVLLLAGAAFALVTACVAVRSR